MNNPSQLKKLCFFFSFAHSGSLDLTGALSAPHSPLSMFGGVSLQGQRTAVTYI